MSGGDRVPVAGVAVPCGVACGLPVGVCVGFAVTVAAEEDPPPEQATLARTMSSGTTGNKNETRRLISSTSFRPIRAAPEVVAPSPPDTDRMLRPGGRRRSTHFAAYLN